MRRKEGKEWEERGKVSGVLIGKERKEGKEWEGRGRESGGRMGKNGRGKDVRGLQAR